MPERPYIAPEVISRVIELAEKNHRSQRQISIQMHLTKDAVRRILLRHGTLKRTLEQRKLAEEQKPLGYVEPESSPRSKVTLPRIKFLEKSDV